MNTIDQLPYLCLRKIFIFLDLRDLVRCRAVSRQFKYFADQIKLDKLVVNDSLFPCECKNWYLTDRSINYGYSIYYGYSIPAVALAKLPLKLAQQLQFLHIHLGYEPDFELENLNGLKLIHLEVQMQSQAQPKTLILPNLKVFKIRFWCPFVLKTPKLEVLSCEEIESIELEYPENIKRLECADARDAPSENRLKTFKNLEVLDYGCYENYADPNDIGLDRIDLSDLPNLKELSVITNHKGRSFEAFRRSMMNLMHQRAALNREDLKFYLMDVLLLGAEQIEDYRTMSKDFFRFKHYRHLHPRSYPTATEVNFNRLMQLGVELSESFFLRFSAIKCLTATNPVRRDQLQFFLKNANALSELTLESISLDISLYAFMESLPGINRRLTDLKVSNCSGPVTSYNFILKFEKLRILETDRQFASLELATSAFQQLKKLVGFQFRADNEVVRIDRNARNKDGYFLKLFTAERRFFQPMTTFCRNHLKWHELAVLYDQMRADPAAGRLEVKKVSRLIFYGSSRRYWR